MREFTDQSTSEIVAVISLPRWEQLVRLARQVEACGAGACDSPACALARAILISNQPETFGPLAPRRMTDAERCPNCTAPVAQLLEHYNDRLGCWSCKPIRAPRFFDR